MQVKSDTGQMDYYAFIDGLEEIAKKFDENFDIENKLPSLKLVVKLIE